MSRESKYFCYICKGSLDVFVERSDKMLSDHVTFHRKKLKKMTDERKRVHCAAMVCLPRTACDSLFVDEYTEKKPSFLLRKKFKKI